MKTIKLISKKNQGPYKEGQPIRTIVVEKEFNHENIDRYYDYEVIPILIKILKDINDMENNETKKPNAPDTKAQNLFTFIAKQLAELINVNSHLNEKDFPGSGKVEIIE